MLTKYWRTAVFTIVSFLPSITLAADQIFTRPNNLGGFDYSNGIYSRRNSQGGYDYSNGVFSWKNPFGGYDYSNGISSRPNLYGGFDYSNGVSTKANDYGGQDYSSGVVTKSGYSLPYNPNNPPSGGFNATGANYNSSSSNGKSMFNSNSPWGAPRYTNELPPGVLK